MFCLIVIFFKGRRERGKNFLFEVVILFGLENMVIKIIKWIFE